MKTRIFLILFSLFLSKGYSQEMMEKESKQDIKAGQKQHIEDMMNAKIFKFVARTAVPSGMRSVNLTTTENYVTFKPDQIDSYMPFYGRAYTTIGYGGEGGIKFKGKPEEFTIDRKKKNFLVNALVKGESDKYRLSLIVGPQGSATLSIISNNRSTISYQGEISDIESEINRFK